MPRVVDANGHRDPNGHGGCGTEGRGHGRRRFAYGNDIDSTRAMKQSDDIRAGERLLDETSGVGGFDGRTHDRPKVQAEYGI